MRVSEALKFKRDLVEETTKHRSVFTSLMLASFMQETTSGKAVLDMDDLEKMSLNTLINEVAFPRLKDAEVIYVGDNVVEDSGRTRSSSGPTSRTSGTDSSSSNTRSASTRAGSSTARRTTARTSGT
jgi:hypothetical protein